MTTVHLHMIHVVTYVALNVSRKMPTQRPCRIMAKSGSGRATAMYSSTKLS